MKKLFLCIVFFNIINIFSQGYQFALGDDLLAMNLFAPIENARTFNFYTSTPLLFNFNLELDYTMYTNNQSDIRVDEASIIINYPIPLIQNVLLVPSIGITISGNLSGNDFSETIKKITSRDYNEGLSDEEMINKYLYSRLSISKKSELLKSSKNSSILFSNVMSELEAITSYTLSATLGYSLLFCGNNFVTDLGYKYGYIYDLTEFNTVNYANGLEDEGKLNLTITAGDFRYDLNLFLNGSFSTGKYSFVFGNKPIGTELTQVNLKIIPGSEYDFGSKKLLSSLQVDVVPFNWAYSRIDIQVNSTYGWNKPNFSNKDLDSYLYEATYYNKLVLGASVNLFENFQPYWITPFLGFAIGVENYQYLNEGDTGFTHLIPIYEFKTGFNILLPQFFIKDNIQYGINGKITYRNSLNDISFKNNFLVNVGLLIAVEL